MFLHRKETERLSNPWWWRPMQACLFIVLLPVALFTGACLGAAGMICDLGDYLYRWNRCEITARPRPWWKRMFEPRRKE